MKERIALWDNIKFILITLVVVGHFADRFTYESDIYKSIFLFIYAFHMPVFIFISGLFHKDTNIVSKCLFYISAGFITKIALFLANTMCGKEYDFKVLSDGGIPWFMFVLAIFTMLMYVLRNQNKRYLLVASIVLACFAGYDASIGDFLYLSRVIVFFPFYLMGTMVEQSKIIEIKKKYSVLVFVAAAVLGIWVIVAFTGLDGIYDIRYLFSGRNPFEPKFMPWGGLIRLLCYGISVLTGMALIFLMPMGNIKGITKMGKNSIDVYFWHWIVYLLLEQWFHIRGLFEKGAPGKFAFLLIAVLVSVVLAQGHLFSFPLKQMKAAIDKQNGGIKDGRK